MSHVYTDYSRARIGFLFGLCCGSSPSSASARCRCCGTPAKGPG